MSSISCGHECSHKWELTASSEASVHTINTSVLVNLGRQSSTAGIDAVLCLGRGIKHHASTIASRAGDSSDRKGLTVYGDGFSVAAQRQR